MNASVAVALLILKGLPKVGYHLNACAQVYLHVTPIKAHKVTDLLRVVIDEI